MWCSNAGVSVFVSISVSFNVIASWSRSCYGHSVVILGPDDIRQLIHSEGSSWWGAIVLAHRSMGRPVECCQLLLYRRREIWLQTTLQHRPTSDCGESGSVRVFGLESSMGFIRNVFQIRMSPFSKAQFSRGGGMLVARLGQ